jgi:voltage-dependent calcium channel
MRNYTEQTGVAFLTSEQRSWLELRKLLRQISPSKRPNERPDSSWKGWCYKRAIHKHGWWQRAMTAVLMLHGILLLVEYHPAPPELDVARGKLSFSLLANLRD